MMQTSASRVLPAGMFRPSRSKRCQKLFSSRRLIALFPLSRTVEANAGDAWNQQAYIKASNTDPGDWFGFALALSGDTLAVTARNEDSSATGVDGDQNDNSARESSAVYLFTRSGGAWMRTTCSR